MTWLFLAGLIFTNWFNRAIFGLFFAELILGGRGRVIEINDTMPIRLAIGILVLVAFLLGWFADGRATSFKLGKSRTCIIASVMGAGTFFFFAVLLGNAYGNSQEYILGDARGFLFLAGALPLLFFATRRKVDVNFVVGCFLSVVCVFGVAKCFGYTLLLARLMSVKQLVATVEEYIPQEVIWDPTSRFTLAPRLYMASDFFLMFVLPLLVSFALATKIRRTRVTLYGAIGIVFIGLLSSQTRGLWLAALLALGVVFWLSNVGSKLKIAVVLPFILLVALGLSHDFLASNEERIMTSFDFKENSSNRGRAAQFQPLMDMATKHIILGNGFGSFAHDHPGVDPRQPYGYELQPLNFLMKMGIVGCGLWGLFLVWLLRCLWRIYKRAEDPAHRVLAKGLVAAMSGMLFASGTNPYFASSPGMGCLLFTVVLCDILGAQVPAPRRKEERISEEQRLPGNAMAHLRGAPSHVRW